MLNAQVVVLFLVVLALSRFTSAITCEQQRKNSSPTKVEIFTVHISEAGVEYNEKIEVDPNKRTELFQVPVHPGVDRSEVLHDFKQNLTMMRLPDSNVCYLFPLLNEESAPEKLIRDLKACSEVLITAGANIVLYNEGAVMTNCFMQEITQILSTYGVYYKSVS